MCALSPGRPHGSSIEDISYLYESNLFLGLKMGSGVWGEGEQANSLQPSLSRNFSFFIVPVPPSRLQIDAKLSPAHKAGIHRQCLVRS
jgi:hypothetical protein